MTPTTEHRPASRPNALTAAPCPAPSLRAGSFIQDRCDGATRSQPLTCAAITSGNPDDAAQVFWGAAQ